jgi:hypothetical protein
VLVCAVAEGERDEVALEIVVAPHRAVRRDHKQLLVLRPSQPLDCAFIPVDAPYEFPRATVNVDARLARLAAPVRGYLVLITVDSCRMSVSMRLDGEASGVVPTAPLYGAPTTL